jgi:hypothetical protein
LELTSLVQSLRTAALFFFCTLFHISHGRNLETLSKFENVCQTFYDKSSGRPYLNLSYSKVEKVYSKFKFLKFGIPKFVVHGLSANLNLATYDHEQVLKNLAHFQKKEAVRFITANDACFNFTFPEQKDAKLEVKILKLSKEGGFSTENAKFSTMSETKFYNFMKLSFERGLPGYKFRESSDGPPTLIISYSGLQATPFENL